MDDCIFCKIAKGDISSFKIYEDEDIVAFLDVNPSSCGHTLVVCKGHYENIFDISEELLCKVNSVVKMLAERIKDRLGCDGIVILQNNGSCAGQSVFHYHMHIKPVYTDSDVSTESLEDVCERLK